MTLQIFYVMDGRGSTGYPDAIEVQGDNMEECVAKALSQSGDLNFMFMPEMEEMLEAMVPPEVDIVDMDIDDGHWADLVESLGADYFLDGLIDAEDEIFLCGIVVDGMISYPQPKYIN